MWSNIVSSLAPYLSSLFAAAFGGFSGAYAAFFLERQRREKEEKKANISSARRAQLNPPAGIFPAACGVNHSREQQFRH
jgi:inosine/xanthosine triphosphate pyrophosphatase family protein